jgi:hypothetical protein
MYDVRNKLDLGAFAKLREGTISFVMSCQSALTPTGRIFIKFDICGFFEKKKLSRNFKFHYNLTRITGTFRVRL